MHQIDIYTKDYCPYCAVAKAHLGLKRYSFNEIDVTNDTDREKEMINRSGRTSVPQIFINDIHIGGCEELIDSIYDGRFEALSQQSLVEAA